MSLPDGRHLSFPFRIAPDGRPAGVASLEDHVFGELIQLLLTNPGERLFVPDFGGGIRRLVFDGNGQSTEAMAKAMVSQAISRYLDQRVILQELVVTAQDAALVIDVVYRPAGSQDPRRLRFERKGG